LITNVHHAGDVACTQRHRRLAARRLRRRALDRSIVANLDTPLPPVTEPTPAAPTEESVPV